MTPVVTSVYTKPRDYRQVRIQVEPVETNLLDNGLIKVQLRHVVTCLHQSP